MRLWPLGGNDLSHIFHFRSRAKQPAQEHNKKNDPIPAINGTTGGREVEETFQVIEMKLKYLLYQREGVIGIGKYNVDIKRMS